MDEAGVDNVSIETEKSFGGIPPDILINRAGAFAGSPKPMQRLRNQHVHGAASLALLVVSFCFSAHVADTAHDGGRAIPYQQCSLPRSAYAAGELVAVKLMEYVGAETDPSVLRVLSVRPGIVPGTDDGQRERR
ncbi:hypothetical protein PG993_006548 [Apiospora rasikravindrae]|uniref:Uncharacterized protein n=1 Tax=Apiospora rasikravindrae TaxID=990691 RepID=A0ABR1T609_9PEZI